VVYVYGYFVINQNITEVINPETAPNIVLIIVIFMSCLNCLF